MAKPARLPLIGLRDRVRQADVFMCCASFESRSQSAPAQLEGMNFARALVCANQNFPKVFRQDARQLMSRFGAAAELVPLSTDDPLRTADSLRDAVDSALKMNLKRFLVDITTFTHESLLILLRIFQLREIESPEFVYTTAKEYSIGDPDEKKWLSKGIGDVRSVLGYPGNALPSRRVHLIIMAGFEADRAERLLQEYEPTELSLGVGDPDYSISPDHYRANKVFHGRLAEKYARVREFTFSCTDPEQTRDVLREQRLAFPEHNTIIAPLNTKISTVGAGMLALRDKSIQLCYATAHRYNQARYSTPGDDCYYFSLSLPTLAV